MALIDATTFIGGIIAGLNIITGSTFLTLMYVMILLFFIAAGFGMPLEASVVIFLPLLLGAAAATGEFYVITAVALIYGAFLIAKNLLNQ